MGERIIKWIAKLAWEKFLIFFFKDKCISTVSGSQHLKLTLHFSWCLSCDSSSASQMAGDGLFKSAINSVL